MFVDDFWDFNIVKKKKVSIEEEGDENSQMHHLV